MSRLKLHRILAGFAGLKQLWRSLNGDATYERYLAHWLQHHAGQDDRPLSRKAFFAAETQRKWNGIKRCC